VSQPSRPATRYEAAKLYLIGKTAARVLDAAHAVLAALSGDGGPDLVARQAHALYTDESGCLTLLFRIKELSAGVLPWTVVEGLNAAYTDLAEHAETADRETLLADARYAIQKIGWLEALIVPDWDVRAKD
jgi:hypothetical protein